MIRIGTGYDVHRLVTNRSLILDGVQIAHPLGLLGHSDADVLVHAIMDALLGALALGDIGKHFPDTDKAYKDCSSLLLLEKVGALVNQQGYRINNIDSTIIAQAPKLKPYMEAMVENIGKTLNLPRERISVKATTEEGLGFTGSEQGIAANAVVSLVKGELVK
jgi:2-C-methyl-D-erythritol 2,4-cyclodiphosphate synthase